MASWIENLQTIAIAAGILSGGISPESKMLLSRVLDTNGDDSGVKNAIGDYSGLGTRFFIQPPAGTIYRIARMIVSVEDAGSFDSGLYGNGITLTSGIVVRVADDSGTIVNLTSGETIKTNGNWGSTCYDIDHSSFGSGNEFLNVRWTFSKFGQEIELNGDNNERLEVVLNDNFAGLVSHHFFVNGYVNS